MDLDELFDDIQNYYQFDATVYQYFKQLLQNRTIIFNEDVKASVIEKVYMPLRDFEKDNSDEPVTLIINSSGGSVADGFFLAHYIAQYKKPLHIIVTGYAYSMAAVLLAGGGKNPNVKRSCYPCTTILIHDGYLALSAQEAKTAGDIMAFNDKIDAQIRQFFLENTKISEKEYDEHARHQWFMEASEMLEKNLVDEIIGGELYVQQNTEMGGHKCNTTLAPSRPRRSDRNKSNYSIGIRKNKK